MRSSRWFRRIGWGFLLAIGWSMAALGVQALSEEQVKGAFLLKFADFVEWPRVQGTSPSAFVVVVVGPDPFGEVLPAEIPPSRPGGFAFRVIRSTDPDQIPPCRILFISAALEEAAPMLLEKMRTLPVLTVGEGEEFLRRGGIIAFVRVEDRVRFLVNLKAAKEAGLKISAKLLQLARNVLR